MFPPLQSLDITYLIAEILKKNHKFLICAHIFCASFNVKVRQSESMIKLKESCSQTDIFLKY